MFSYVKRKASRTDRMKVKVCSDFIMKANVHTCTYFTHIYTWDKHRRMCVYLMNVKAHARFVRIFESDAID